MLTDDATVLPKRRHSARPNRRSRRVVDLVPARKALWGYARACHGVGPGGLAGRRQGDRRGYVWVATTANGSIAGVVALAPGEQSDRLDLTSSSSSAAYPGRVRPRAARSRDAGGATPRRNALMSLVRIRMPPRFTSAAARTGSGRRRPTRSRGAWCILRDSALLIDGYI